ncbi:hypothetical protein Ancab_035408 [Ancistrocladus abbreviatus]
MADQEHNYDHHHQQEGEIIKSEEAVPVESTDRGIFDFMKKKDEEKPQEEVIVTEFEKVHVSEHEPKVEHAKKEEHKEAEKENQHSLLEKLHRSGSSSSSSSDEEEGEDGEKKKKKKKEKKGLLRGHKEEEKHHEKHEEDSSVPVEKYEEKIHVEEVVHSEPSYPEEKKGFFDKIKEKLPGQQKKPEDHVPAPAAEHSITEPEGEGKEKKGFLDKIKEKIPGLHHKHEEEKEKEKEKEREIDST